MPRLLLINPNTSESVTAMLMRHARAELPPGMEIVPVTAAFGAEYITSEVAFAIAAHAALDAYSAARGPWDAVLLACFGDPALHALREISPCPVVGFADTAMAQAAREAGTGGRFAIVTGGARWQPMLSRMAASFGYAGALGGVYTLALDGGQIARDPEAAIPALRDAVLRAVAECSAKAVVIGGAGLAGLAARLQPDSPVPLIDSVHAGLTVACEFALEHARARPLPDAAPEPARSKGLGAELGRLLR